MRGVHKIDGYTWRCATRLNWTTSGSRDEKCFDAAATSVFIGCCSCFLPTCRAFRVWRFDSKLVVPITMLPKGTRTLTLKQRLAALTQSPSSPQSPLDSSLRSPTSKRRFNAPWVRRPPAQNGHHQNEFIGEDRLQFIITKMIYQAGVDYESVSPTHCRPTLSHLFITWKDAPDVTPFARIRRAPTYHSFLPLHVG